MVQFRHLFEWFCGAVEAVMRMPKYVSSAAVDFNEAFLEMSAI